MCYNAPDIMTTVIFIKGLDKYPDRVKQAGIADYAHQYGWDIQSVEAVDSIKKLKAIVDLWSPDGIIVNCGAGSNALPPSGFGKIPVVFFAYPSAHERRSVNYVYNDATATAKLAAMTLLRLNLTSYGYVNWFKPLSWNEARREAFSKVLSLHGKPVAVFTSRLSKSTDFTKALVSWLRNLPKPVGLFAANDTIARHVANACRLAKLAVPDDVAILGVDNDIDICERASPTLTSIRLGHYDSGRLAAQLLDQMMHKRLHRPTSVSYPCAEVVNRESTRRLLHPDRIISQAIERIRKDACTGLSAAEIIKGLPYSRRIAEIRFREATGKSILEEIRDVRLQKAIELLKDTNQSISSIANQAGYDTLPAFSAFFKAKTGFAPSVWKSKKLHHSGQT